MNKTKGITLIGGPAPGKKDIEFRLSKTALVRVPCYGHNDAPTFFCYAMYGMCTIPKADTMHTYIFLGWDSDGGMDGGMT